MFYQGCQEAGAHQEVEHVLPSLCTYLTMNRLWLMCVVLLLFMVAICCMHTEFWCVFCMLFFFSLFSAQLRRHLLSHAHCYMDGTGFLLSHMR